MCLTKLDGWIQKYLEYVEVKSRLSKALYGRLFHSYVNEPTQVEKEYWSNFTFVPEKFKAKSLKVKGTITAMEPSHDCELLAVGTSAGEVRKL